MGKSISLRDANQNFAKYVRQVQSGEEFIITKRGEPVARLSPISAKRVLTLAQEEALERTRKRLKKGWPLGIGKIERDSLYDR